jgi:hypothetical protein
MHAVQEKAFTLIPGNAIGEFAPFNKEEEGTTRSTRGTRKVMPFLCLLCFLWFLPFFPVK